MFEAGKSLPRSDTILALCDYFDVSADYLLGLSDLRHSDALVVAEKLEAIYGKLYDIRQAAADAMTAAREA